jgi:cytoskeletal protein CcmA (bactofilin family)
MWNRRKEEENTYKPASAPPPTSSELVKEAIPMSTLPTRSTVSEPHHEPQRGGSAVLGKSVVVKGQIFSREDLTIDGEVEGTVELQEHRLTVGQNGKVVASIKAREVVVLGTVHGNVETTDKIEIRRDAKLIGDIRTARIVIEDGAYFKGNIDIIRADAPRQEPKQAQKSQSAQSANSTASPVMAAGAGDNKR